MTKFECVECKKLFNIKNGIWKKECAVYSEPMQLWCTKCFNIRKKKDAMPKRWYQ